MAAAGDFARADIPESAASALTMARLTALQKPNNSIRGIATGNVFRRLVARTLARRYAKNIERAVAPFQYALSTRAGTDCVGHMFRAITDADPNATIVSVDGIGAYDHIFRAEMLSKLCHVPEAAGMVPFLRLSYGHPSEYLWSDDSGATHRILQGDGGEQGDPLMPLLFSLGIHEALREVSEQLLPGEKLCAFLDDVYVVCQPERARAVLIF